MARSIVRTKELCNGRVRLSGTRIEVQAVIKMVQADASLEEICDAFPGLTLGDLDVIQSYYAEHTAEIDFEMAGKPVGTSMSLKERVLEFVARSGEKGVTDKEIQKALRIKVTTEVPRRRELVVDGKIVETGRRKGRSIVWKVKSQFRDELWRAGK